MSSVDLVLKNAKIVTSSDVFEGGVGVESGQIVAMGKDANLPQAEKVIDLNGKLLMPGFIDAHSHVRGMQRSEWEDFTSGTMAAAAGGITTIMEMPITVPPTSSATNFVEKKRVAEHEAVVNFALYAGAGSQNIEEIPKMAEEGAIAFKTFMHPPPAGREKDFYGLYVTDDGSFLEVLKAVARTGLISAVHAENPEIVDHLMNKLQQEGKKDLSAFLSSRPGITESEAIMPVAMLGTEAGARMHICHVSAKEAVSVVAKLKEEGRRLTAETCPQYLTLTHEEVKALGPYAKVNPPIRHAEDHTALWKALRSGVIDIVVTDHAVFPKNVKEAGREDIWKAYMGAPGLDTMMPIMLNEVNRGMISLHELVRVLSENVAKIFGLYPRKGALQLGSDADMVVVDLQKRRKLRAAEFYTKAKEIALLYDGKEVQGLPVATFVNGIEVMKDSLVSGKPGTGRFLRPLTRHPNLAEDVDSIL